jgi:hypothetical protein
MKRELLSLENSLSETRREKASGESEFESYCTDKAGIIKTLLRSNDRNNKYNNYNKADFKRECIKLASAADYSEHILSDDKRGILLHKKDALPKDKINPIDIVPPDMDILYGNVKDLLGQTVVSQVIESLKADHE